MYVLEKDNVVKCVNSEKKKKMLIVQGYEETTKKAPVKKSDGKS